MHENDISMAKNDISMHENLNFAPGMIFFAQDMGSFWKKRWRKLKKKILLFLEKRWRKK